MPQLFEHLLYHFYFFLFLVPDTHSVNEFGDEGDCLIVFAEFVAEDLDEAGLLSVDVAFLFFDFA
jgi:hypothetical protein